VINTERAASLAALQEKLGYTFHTPAILNCALTHKSYASEAGIHCHYERLEFLGDAVLDVIVSTYLYTTYPTCGEGQLTKLRARLVNASSLAELACQIDLGNALLLGRGEERSGGRGKHSLLAAALEAVIAAIYLDGGLAVAQEVFWRCFTPAVTCRLTSAQGRDYKGLLQEYALRVFGCMPTYDVIREEGPAHQKTFYVQLTLHGASGCIGIGQSKKAAEQQAAQQLLAVLQRESLDGEGHRPPPPYVGG
jgi:ribonuclease-3